MKKYHYYTVRALIFAAISAVLYVVTNNFSHYLPPEIGQVDFQQYWSAARAFINLQNPYSAEVIGKYQELLGIVDKQLWIRLWNPPQILSLIWPLGLLEFKQAACLFLIINLLLLMASLHILFGKERETTKYRVLRGICFLTFYPIIACLGYGQFSIVLMFGLLLFLELKSDLLKGVALSLTLLKPHLLFLLYFALFLDSLRNRDFKVLIAMLLTGLLLSLTVFTYSPNIFLWYLSALAEPPLYFKTPTLGSWLHEYFGYQHRWSRLLPSALALIVYFIYWIRSKNKLERSDILLLIPISLISSPYGWLFDQVLILPTLFYSFRASRQLSQANRQLFLLSIISLGIAVFFLPVSGQQYYFWYPLVLFGLFKSLQKSASFSS